MCKTSKFREKKREVASVWAGAVVLLAYFFAAVPTSAAQGQQVAAQGRQTIERFLCDLPYTISLPVTLLLSAILFVYAVKSKGKRRLFGYIFFFMAVLMLWMVSNSQLLAAVVPDLLLLKRISSVLLYLLPAAANLVVSEVLEPPFRRVQLVVVGIYAVFLAAAVGFEMLGFPGLTASRPLYYVLLLVLEGCVFACLWRSARAGNAYSRALLFPLTTLTVLGIFDGINAALRLTPLPTYVMPLGVYSFLFFILQLIRDQLKRAELLKNRALRLSYRAAFLQERADRDPLTQCRNRGSFEAELPAAIWTARQAGEPLSLLLFDVDHFKQFNDTYGHAAGDTVLRGFARTVRAELDKQKSFYRWGGEEFVVLLPGEDVDAAAVVGNHLRRTVAAFLHYEKRPVTVSVGVSVYHGGCDTAQAMFQRADEALYAAKEAGRDCLRVERPQRAEEEAMA